MRAGTLATPTPTPVWYVRKNGWLQGPFSPALVRQMYASAWIGAVDRVGRSRTGPWQEVREVPELTATAGDERCPAPAEGWEVASPLLSIREPVEFGVLQMFAVAGRLLPNDLVRRMPDGDWQPARLVGGIFGGQAAQAAQSGRAEPAEASSVVVATTLGCLTLGILLLTAVAVIAFSLSFFGIVRT